MQGNFEKKKTWMCSPILPASLDDKIEDCQTGYPFKNEFVSYLFLDLPFKADKLYIWITYNLASTSFFNNNISYIFAF